MSLPTGCWSTDGTREKAAQGEIINSLLLLRGLPFGTHGFLSTLVQVHEKNISGTIQGWFHGRRFLGWIIHCLVVWCVWKPGGHNARCQLVRPCVDWHSPHFHVSFSTKKGDIWWVNGKRSLHIKHFQVPSWSLRHFYIGIVFSPSASCRKTHQHAVRQNQDLNRQPFDHHQCAAFAVCSAYWTSLVICECFNWTVWRAIFSCHSGLNSPQEVTAFLPLIPWIHVHVVCL